MESDTRSTWGWLRRHMIFEVECPEPDITDNARGKFIPINQFLCGGEPRLPESIMIQRVTGEYPTSPCNMRPAGSLPLRLERRHV